MKRTACIVEDEPLARKTLRELLAGEDWLEVVGEAADGLAAVELINASKPDLVFLDIHLPELSGLEVLKRLTHEPRVIFTTAHDRHAIAAFELAALDYLLKPFGRARFKQALARARETFEREESPAGIARARAALGSPADAPLERMLIRHGGRIVPVRVQEIDRIDADGDYAAVHVAGKTLLVNLPLGELEQKLNAARFVRVHRSHLVNLDFVEALEPYDNAQLVVRMKDGTRIVASRPASRRLRESAM